MDWDRVERVDGLIPDRFEARARIFHPAYVRTAGELHPIRWSAVAEMNGNQLAPASRFENIAVRSGENPLEVFVSPPWGEIPRFELSIAEARALAEILSRHTTTPDRCYFGLWHGYGMFQGVRGPSLEALGGNREYWLFRGAIEGVAAFQFGPWEGQPPNLWWPEDRAWFVHCEVDGYDSHVGGSRACIDELVASTELEALEVPLGLTPR